LKVRYWLPPVVWACVILAASSDAFSSSHTGGPIRAILEGVFGPLSDVAFDRVHFAIRKASHLTEYAILGTLLFRAFRAEAGGWQFRWARNAVIVAGLVATMDEAHQAMVPTRGSSPVDVAIDVAGAAAAQAALRRVTKPIPDARSTA
jgi:VanZ family protein